MINVDEKVSYKEFFENAREVYSWLEDEQSKRIFEARMPFSITNSLYSIGQIAKYASSFIQNTYTIYEQNIYNVDIKKEDTIVVYGAGGVGKVFYNRIKNSCNAILCDRNYKDIVDYDVISPDELIQNYKDAKVAVFAASYCIEIHNFLTQNGIKKENIYLGSESDFLGQYFDKDIIKFKDEEVFVDCGGFDGQTSVEFVKRSNNYKKIYFIEPDSNNLEKAKNNFKKHNINNVDFFNLGVWNKKDTLKFQNTGTVASAINDEGEVEVGVDSIDNLVNITPQDRGVKPTFVKMDVEGAELNALKGAEKTIRECKPKLAISIYHKPEDIMELLIYIKHLVPEYKFYLRHYTSHDHDTVLYAVID